MQLKFFSKVAEKFTPAPYQNRMLVSRLHFKKAGLIVTIIAGLCHDACKMRERSPGRNGHWYFVIYSKQSSVAPSSCCEATCVRVSDRDFLRLHGTHGPIANMPTFRYVSARRCKSKMLNSEAVSQSKNHMNTSSTIFAVTSSAGTRDGAVSPSGSHREQAYRTAHHKAYHNPHRKAL